MNAKQARSCPEEEPVGKLPAPGRLADVAQKAAMYGCVDLDTLTLTDWGRRVLAILGGGEEQS